MSDLFLILNNTGDVVGAITAEENTGGERTARVLNDHAPELDLKVVVSPDRAFIVVPYEDLEEMRTVIREKFPQWFEVQAPNE